jgi:hypothetical protein
MSDLPNIEYEPLQHEPIPKRLLVIGTPRSGTHFFTKLMQGFGMRVQHERMGEDGTVNCAWLAMRMPNDPVIKVTGRQNYDFDRIIHLIRHPLPTIASMSHALHGVFWEWQEIHSNLHIHDTTDLEKLAAFWLFWTDGCKHLCDTAIRLEDIAHLGPPVAESKIKKQITLTDLGCMGGEVSNRMADYGYKP